jgi:predicted aspartyl protease
MRRLYFAIFILLYIQCPGQSSKDQLKIVNSANTELKDFYQEFHFVDRLGYFIIPIKIGTETYEYIFDTGGYNTATTEIMQKNELPELMKVKVGSSNQIKSEIKLSKIPRLYIGNVPFDNVGVFIFDFEESPIIKCYTNGGLIGKGIIKECIWQIDYQNKLIRIADRLDKMPNLDNSIKFKIELDKVFNPFVKAQINGKTEKFLLDFGYGGFISLNQKTADKYSFTKTTEIDGEGAIGANGTINEKTFAVTLQSLTIGGQNFTNQVAFYSKSNNYNLIGSEISKYFLVTLNFKDKELILTPIKRETTETFRSFGFDLNSKDGKIYISRLYKNHTAEQAGLLLNDEVTKINGDIFNEMDYCTFYFSIRELFQSDKEIRIEVKRGNELKEFIIAKKSLAH